jgi:serine protease AprX
VTTRRTVWALLAVIAGAALGGPLAANSASAAPASAVATVPSARTDSTSIAGSVIVITGLGRREAVEQAAVRLGARVTRRLGIINGFGAQASAETVRQLRGVPGVLSVSTDQPMTPMSIVPALGYDPADAGSLSSVTQIVGAQSVWAKGYTGAGIGVAVIDTGVTPVPGLDGPGKVVTGPDLSFDASGATTPGLDAFGHGTFMAGLIAGHDSAATSTASGCTTCLNTSGYSNTATFVGVAPDARIINVKVGAADGATDVSQVIAAIDWVTQHAHDPGVNIRVLNLSFGTNSTQPYTVDPLAQAAEQAWKHGIVVVAAAGNDGKAAENLADPAYDPYVLAVGADDPLGTLATGNDVVPKFAQHGTTNRPVDVIAPATHVLGLRVPGSFVDTTATNTGQVGSRFQRGSGTSEATAITTGVVALLAQKYPLATPDQLKALLRSTTVPLPKDDKTATDPKTILYSGNGIVNAGQAASAALPLLSLQLAIPSSGSGNLDATRGGTYVTDNGVPLTGQKDIFGRQFSSGSMATAQLLAASWTGGVWNGSRWTGDGWTGGSWTGATWTGTDWAGSRWSGSRWSGMTWDGSRWSGTGWSGSRWSGSTWDGSRWSSSTWS